MFILCLEFIINIEMWDCIKSDMYLIIRCSYQMLKILSRILEYSNLEKFANICIEYVHTRIFLCMCVCVWARAFKYREIKRKYSNVFTLYVCTYVCVYIYFLKVLVLFRLKKRKQKNVIDALSLALDILFFNWLFLIKFSLSFLFCLVNFWNA